MIVNKQNYLKTIGIFKESVFQSDFISFDCEMSGITYDLSTEGTKYDTHQLRYMKCKEIVKKFDLIQFGITCYIREEKFYIERTFTFYLFKNSKLKFLNEMYNHEMNIFNSIPMFHPGSLKFLNENNFDFNALISTGIHYNKIKHIDKIRDHLNFHYENGKLPNNLIYMSKTNEEIIVKSLKQMLEFLLDSTEKERKISGLTNNLMNYLISLNYKTLFKISQFNLLKDKDSQDTLIIKKSKIKLGLDEFIKTHSSFEEFWKTFNFYENVVKNKYSQFILEKNSIEEQIHEEIGFSNFIQILIDSKKPLIGHNLYFDLLFLYDKFIDDLPDNFLSYKTLINFYFPHIFDTKYITSRYAKEFDNTKLESIFKLIKKNKYDSSVLIKSDILNGFINITDNSFHDAGYDSVITGRCFVYILLGLEKKTGNNIDFVDFNSKVIINLINKSSVSLIPEPFDTYSFTDDSDIFNSNEEKLIEIYKNVYYVKLKDSCLTIYEIASLFESLDFNISVIKIDSDAAFVEFIGLEETIEYNHDNILYMKSYKKYYSEIVL